MTTATQRPTKLPSISSYGDYSSNNYGINALEVTIGGLTLYFSYKTVIAFEAPGETLVIRQNAWSTTTGKHLNAIDRDHSRRIPGADFEAKLRETLEKHGLTE